MNTQTGHQTTNTNKVQNIMNTHTNISSLSNYHQLSKYNEYTNTNMSPKIKTSIIIINHKLGTKYHEYTNSSSN